MVVVFQAISSTIQRDPTAAHYKYHDDPYLIPVSNFQKRAYALSQESGRKSAQWILNQHPNLFNHKVAFPPIEVKLCTYNYFKINIYIYIKK